jgi:hypothetical protein
MIFQAGDRVWFKPSKTAKKVAAIFLELQARRCAILVETAPGQSKQISVNLENLSVRKEK